MSGRLFVIPVDPAQRIRVITYPGREEPGLATLCPLVGGWITLVGVQFQGRLRDAYVNEEGIPRGLLQNSRATELLAPGWEHARPVLGPLVIWVPGVTRPVRRRAPA